MAAALAVETGVVDVVRADNANVARGRAATVVGAVDATLAHDRRAKAPHPVAVRPPGLPARVCPAGLPAFPLVVVEVVVYVPVALGHDGPGHTGTRTVGRVGKVRPLGPGPSTGGLALTLVVGITWPRVAGPVAPPPTGGPASGV